MPSRLSLWFPHDKTRGVVLGKPCCECFRRVVPSPLAEPGTIRWSCRFVQSHPACPQFTRPDVRSRRNCVGRQDSNTLNKRGHKRRFRANHMKPNRLTKILFVDDDPLMHELYRPHVERAGYEWIGARDGQKAIEMVARESPCLVVMDVQMPERDGLSTVMELKKGESTRAIPVIVMTSAP